MNPFLSSNPVKSFKISLMRSWGPTTQQSAVLIDHLNVWERFNKKEQSYVMFLTILEQTFHCVGFIWDIKQDMGNFFQLKALHENSFPSYKTAEM